MAEITKVDEKVDFNVGEVISYMIEVERQKRYAAEVKIFFILKDLINTLNRYAQSPLDILKLVASRYKTTLKYFQTGLNSADKWTLDIISNLARYIEACWKHELKTEVVCEFTHIEEYKDMMYIILFEIESEHLISSNINFFLSQLIKWNFFLWGGIFFSEVIFF